MVPGPQRTVRFAHAATRDTTAVADRYNFNQLRGDCAFALAAVIDAAYDV
jgi:hypothetical protein